ncbi:MAG: OpgC domain-containing protein, partial [Gluconacetobacter diazotrophicus]|nr:OpgC domain-containing protein [Gluconacetobacter diazotrophicus]
MIGTLPDPVSARRDAGAGDADTVPAPAPPRSKRDHRVDALRGVALTMMFCDHIPQNVLNRFTLRNLGFCDAAEVFVLLAGFASMLAYGRAFERSGVRFGLERLGQRVVKLYLFQMAMMVTFIVVIRLWRHELHPVPVDFLEPELAHGTHGLWRVLILDALPGNLNILPLYIALLIAFPLMYWGLTRAK